MMNTNTKQAAWENLYRILETAQHHHPQTELCLDENDQIFVTVEELSRVMTGCGCCNAEFESFCVVGKIRASFLEDPQHIYSASIYINGCRKQDAEALAKFEPLFRGYVEDTNFPDYDYYISESPFIKIL